MVTSLDELSDRSVLLSLQELTEFLPDGGEDGVTGQDEAWEAVRQLLVASRVNEVPPVWAWQTDADAMAVARRLLALAMRDPDTAQAAREIVADPPQDDQMSVEMAVAGAVVLGALIGWLQTKISLRISRKDGKTEFEFSVTKTAASPGLLRDIASTVSQLLTRGPNPPQ